MESTKLKVLATECACERCSQMCQAPCCPTPEEVIVLIERGYAGRLMLDDWPGQADIVKPALKGHEGEKAPWSVKTLDGCTFWTADGKCALHSRGLKPLQGRLAHHDLTDEENASIAEQIEEAWTTDKAAEVIEAWKQFVKYR